MDERLKKSLSHLATMMECVSEPWWIIGSTAMVLGGVQDIEPEDIDVVADGKMLQRLLGVPEFEPTPHEKFRSKPYTRVKVAGGMDIEFQGDLALWENNKWSQILFYSRIETRINDVVVYVPSLDEQLLIFRRFGRPKDLAKALVLEAFIQRQQT